MGNRMLNSEQASDTPSSIRIRENQRRSRNQRKELIQDLQRRVQEYELKGIAATQDMQRAARKVAEENARLRSLLASRGVTRDEVDAYLRSFDAAAAPLPTQRVPEKRQPERMQPTIQPAHQPLAGAVQHQAHPVDGHTNTPTALPLYEPAVSIAPHEPSYSRPPDGGIHDGSASTFSMLQGDPDCPNTANCFCAPTPVPQERPMDTGLLISCETAATIIAEMRGDADRNRIKASLGCRGQKDCVVKNTLVLELMDQR